MFKIFAALGDVLHLPKKETEKHLVVTGITWHPQGNTFTIQSMVGCQL